MVCIRQCKDNVSNIISRTALARAKVYGVAAPAQPDELRKKLLLVSYSDESIYRIRYQYIVS